jgi:hypothetical protein
MEQDVSAEQTSAEACAASRDDRSSTMVGRIPDDI